MNSYSNIENSSVESKKEGTIEEEELAGSVLAWIM
jgi:hypothetical protein